MGAILKGNHAAIKLDQAFNFRCSRARVSVTAQIGFMQGRLSPIVDGRIQAFPWTCWQTEFRVAQEYSFHLVEWTLDQHRLHENPLLTLHGQQEIRALCELHNVAIPSLTGDCFMQAPYWRAERVARESL